MPAAIQDIVVAFADFLLKYFVALAAVGALAMALLELAKKLFDWRTRYHASAVTRWIRAWGGTPHDAAYAELLHLCTGTALESAQAAATALLRSGGRLPGILWLAPTPEYAVFALDTERMLGHLEDAADVALSTPSRYPHLFDFVTNGADAHDRGTWQSEAERAVGGAMEMTREEAKLRADIYARLHQISKRKLDAFQLYASTRWATRMQLWSNVLGMVILFTALQWAQPSAGRPRPSLAESVALSLFGGVLAPVAKDIVEALQQVRQRV
jgi:hypothetical protein